MNAVAKQPVLNCPLLRDAVYRNRTSSRALRHNIALSCVPVAMLPAVAPWLPPWDVVSPKAALRGLRSLELIQRRPSQPTDTDESKRAAHRTCSDLAYCLECTAPQLIMVTSLTLRLPSTHLGGVGEHLLRRILRCVPALRSLTLSSVESFVAEDIGGVALGEPGDRYLELAPKLTTLDIRDVSQGDLSFRCVTPLLMRSLLCSRLSLRTLVTCAPMVVSAIANEYTGLTPRVVSDQPCYTPLSPAEVTGIKAIGRWIPPSVLRLHSPAWTLRSFTMESRHTWAFTAQALCRFIFACPQLRFLKLAWRRRWGASSWADSTPFDPLVEREQQWHERAGHAAVLRVADAVREQHSALQGLSPAHVATLAAIASEEHYPASLAFVFARGFDLTTLERVDVGGALGDQLAVTFNAAVEAARLLRKSE